MQLTDRLVREGDPHSRDNNRGNAMRQKRKRNAKSAAAEERAKMRTGCVKGTPLKRNAHKEGDKLERQIAVSEKKKCPIFSRTHTRTHVLCRHSPFRHTRLFHKCADIKMSTRIVQRQKTPLSAFIPHIFLSPLERENSFGETHLVF